VVIPLLSSLAKCILAKAIELMIVDALLAADPHMDISSRIYDPARFTYLSDDILLEVERSTAPVGALT
jgi:hypothetical protein